MEEPQRALEVKINMTGPCLLQASLRVQQQVESISTEHSVPVDGEDSAGQSQYFQAKVQNFPKALLSSPGRL